MKILIVDDNKDLANGLREILLIDKHDIDVFYDAESSLMAIDSTSYDIAFIDVKLPGMNGVELFKIIKQKTPRTHAFIISGYRITQIIQESTGIEHTVILNEYTKHDELVNYINNIESSPLTLAITDSDHYLADLTEQFNIQNKKVLIINDQQLQGLSPAGYDVLILNTSKPLIHGLIQFIEIRRQGYDIPTVLISDKSINNDSKNKLHSFQLTGCIFKPFQLDQILDIVDSIQHGMKPERNSPESAPQETNIRI